ncbi:YdeI/OmpD-associated family protein [Flectobacillus rivi]|uniref:YdeI/OmpD-associated family protein n=1 Tax=Flectobacillus rivi TaxID=2984209 RepID=A0ABT6YVK2_9BACT|nr:YdeI/OmpD-associated family protein [Flectobacillus rivi]MDI9872910.1 YdeI/OmpD-associated family protein [Flectobacillus rivi]
MNKSLETMQEVETFYPQNIAEWRDWLEKHHHSHQSIWVVFYKKSSGVSTITWSEAVDMALCFGWIDSKKVSVDAVQSLQFFSKRKAKSTWSKINKDKIEKLIEAELMAPAGLESIRIAKENGSWTVLDGVEALVIPSDFMESLQLEEGLSEKFESLSKSAKKEILYKLLSAKRPETRQKRIEEIVALLQKGK